jgi:hypothetical protein
MIVSRPGGDVTVGPGSIEGGVVAVVVTCTVVAGSVVGVGVGVSTRGAAHPARITQAMASVRRVRILACIPLRRGCRFMAFVEGFRNAGRTCREIPGSPLNDTAGDTPG